MQRQPFFVLALFLIGTALITASCNKDRLQTYDGELRSTLDHSFADAEFSAIRTLVDLEGRADTSIYGKTTGTQTAGLYCPTSTVSAVINGGGSATLTVDFGSGSNCIDGRLRTGKIIAEFNGFWNQTGSSITVSPDGYTVSGFPVEFDMTIRQNGANASGNLSWDVEVSNAAIYTAEGTISWETNRTTEWVGGQDTFDATDNEYEITGTSSGTSRFQRTFEVEVTTPLLVRSNCPNVVSGVLNLTPQDLETRSIDYGEGTCDKVATLTVGTFTGAISLP